VHTGEKPFECVICKNKFSTNSNLTDHKRLHTGENHFSCDVCQKSFAQSSGLYKHNKTAAHIERMKSKNTNTHLAQSSFVDCGGTIKVEDIKEEVNEEGRGDDPLSILPGTISTYQKSSNTNTSHKQHSCDICGKLFSDKSMLDIHKFIHIGEKQKVVEEFAISIIKEEVKEEVNNDYVEIKEEVNMDDPLCSLE
jgi:KRAB domain-containing zinc finger protein